MEKLQEQFYKAFLYKDRWEFYLSGLKITCLLTLGALAIGIVLGGQPGSGKSVLTVYDIENLDDAFFRLNQDIDAILNITQKLRNLNKVVYRLYSISHYFSDLLDVGSEIKRLKDSV